MFLRHAQPVLKLAFIGLCASACAHAPRSSDDRKTQSVSQPFEVTDFDPTVGGRLFVGDVLMVSSTVQADRSFKITRIDHDHGTAEPSFIRKDLGIQLLDSRGSVLAAVFQDFFDEATSDCSSHEPNSYTVMVDGEEQCVYMLSFDIKDDPRGKWIALWQNGKQIEKRWLAGFELDEVVRKIPAALIGGNSESATQEMREVLSKKVAEIQSLLDRDQRAANSAAFKKIDLLAKDISALSPDSASMAKVLKKIEAVKLKIADR